MKTKRMEPANRRNPIDEARRYVQNAKDVLKYVNMVSGSPTRSSIGAKAC